jgi:hypothetical protein
VSLDDSRVSTKEIVSSGFGAQTLHILFPEMRAARNYWITATG